MYTVPSTMSSLLVFQSIKLHLCTTIIFFFFFNDTATTEIYTLSLHDALPISTNTSRSCAPPVSFGSRSTMIWPDPVVSARKMRSEEHTSELQSRLHLVCRLLLEKKKKNHKQQLDH